MVHDITMATTVAERDIMTATTRVERDITTATGEMGEAGAVPAGAVLMTEAQAPTIEAPKVEAEAEARRPPSYAVVPPDVWALARAVAAVLGETLPPPLRIITRIVDRLGPARARAFLGQALTVEAQGGLTLPDGRRRTPGGVFFHLVRQSPDVTPDERAYIFPLRPGHPPTEAAPPPTPPRPPTP